MVYNCSVCDQRARGDGSCKTGGCSQFVPLRFGKGEHWKVKRLQKALGDQDAATCLGDFIQGGLAASLSHRHDVRVGIASGMFLRERITSVPLRLEVLCLPFLCYWKWASASILKSVASNLELLLASDVEGRASLYERFWDQATQEVRPEEFVVVCHRKERTTQLFPKAKVRSLGGNGADFFSYHSMMNPATTRRLASEEFKILMGDLRSGRLKTAIDALADIFAAPGANYKDGEVPLRKVHLWSHAQYSRVRFLRWLFKAEGVAVEPSDDDWGVLAGMGTGAVKGTKNLSYEDALEACRVVSEDFWAVSDGKYGLDDLVCLLCLSHSSEAVGGSQLPGRAAPVTVAGDLGDLVPRAPAAEQGSRKRLSQKTSGASRAASGAACSSGRPRPCRPRWAKGLLGPTRRPPIFSQLPPDTLLDLLPLPDQARVCRTSRTLRARLLCHVRLWGRDCWRRVFDRAHDLVVRDGPMHAALTTSGVSGGDLLRIVACACDLVDSLLKQPLPVEEPLMALAVARYGLRSILTSEQRQALAHHVCPGGCMHLPHCTVEHVERSCGRALHSDRDPTGPGAPLQ